ncbi:hypothetical protein OHA40_10265 [Nocardia sp. NBC_00508]|uniref:hypothetical protein n=1 Tax=Nocardia sp. NBC_00508 TaxID=2975992 RepID=UPI002E822E68|nr:hypothetical protein [Nocardia sp. NBC_00508]WUD68451.1 hypothetical protein OHA40_10265 [Nocardia sp. NBC_00508]
MKHLPEVRLGSTERASAMPGKSAYVAAGLFGGAECYAGALFGSRRGEAGED